MKGFKDSTRTKYMGGGRVDGRSAVMGQPDPGMSRAAAMSGREMPTAGKPTSVGLDRAAAMSGRAMPATGRPAMNTGGAVASGNRMSKENAKDFAAVRRTTKPAAKPLPSAGKSVESGNRISKQEAAEMRAMGLKKGGLAAMPKKGKC